MGKVMLLSSGEVKVRPVMERRWHHEVLCEIGGWDVEVLGIGSTARDSRAGCDIAVMAVGLTMACMWPAKLLRNQLRLAKAGRAGVKKAEAPAEARQSAGRRRLAPEQLSVTVMNSGIGRTWWHRRAGWRRPWSMGCRPWSRVLDAAVSSSRWQRPAS